MSGFQLPSKEYMRKIGGLDPEVAGEGGKVVIMSDGEVVAFNPPPPDPVIPDMSKIKSIAHYFYKKAYRPFPTWLYHPTEPAIIVKNAEEAAQLGVSYRETTQDERAKFGLAMTWDWEDGTPWRTKPYEKLGAKRTVDPNNPGAGKTFVASPVNAALAQNALLAELIPTVAAAVTAALKKGDAGQPAATDPDYAEFLEFKAWKASQAALTEVAEQAIASAAADAGEDEDEAPNALNALTPEQERKVWEAEAEAHGIKVDGRWSLERLKAEVQKATKAA